MNSIYRSKIDTWLGVVLVGVPVASLFTAWHLVNAQVPGRWLLAIPVVLLGVFLPLPLLFFTTYTITDSFLKIRSGFFTWNIPIHSICGLEATSNPASSPALSLDRIRIDYGPGKSVAVSPLRKDGFLRDLHSLRVPRA